MSAPTTAPTMSDLRVRGWATRRSNKIKISLIETAPPMTQEQIDGLVALLRAHEVMPATVVPAGHEH